MSDREWYVKIQEAMKPLAPLFAAGNQDATKEYLKLWAESETIKNRHGGFPPAEETNQQQKG